MRKLIKNLIVILILTACQSAFCYTLNSKELNKIIFDKINSETKEHLCDVEYKLNIQNISTNDIVTGDFAAPKIEISSTQGFNPVSYRRVTIKDLKGNTVKTFPLNIRISIYQDVLVASENIPFGDAISKKNAKFEKREVSKLYGKTISEFSDNLISSRNIMKGSIIQPNSIKYKAIIEKNQNVDIVFQGKGVRISLKGKALKEGSKGDIIPVQSDKYNKIYSAKIDSDSKVTVRI